MNPESKLIKIVSVRFTEHDHKTVQDHFGIGKVSDAARRMLLRKALLAKLRNETQELKST